MNFRNCLAGVLLLACCAGPSVFSDHDEAADFSHYKTFAWLPHPDVGFKNSQYDNHIVESNVKNFANQEMLARGYVIDLDSPDLLLEYRVEVEMKQETEERPVYAYPYNYMWYDPFYRPYIFGYAPPPYVVGYQTRDISYKEGTLTISAIDRKKNRLVWRGWAVSFSDPTKYEVKLKEDIKKIFKKYPAHAKGKARNK